MRFLLFTAAIALAGCAVTTAHLEQAQPFIVAASQKSAGALSECFASAWQHRSGMVSSTQKEHGFTMTLSYTVLSSAIVAAAIDVDDRGDRRSVVVHARKGDANSKMRREVENCL